MSEVEVFQQQVKDSIKNFLPTEFLDADVKLRTVTKNNGTKLHALMIFTPGRDVCPSIYLDSFYEDYQQGMEMDVVLRRIAQLELEHMVPSESIGNIIEKFSDMDYIKSHVIMEVVNAGKNAEMLQDTPHKMKEDLAIIYKLYLDDVDGSISTSIIKDVLMKQWDISLDELHECAMENSKTLLPVKVQDMGTLLGELLGGIGNEAPTVPDSNNSMMYVITNKQKTNGAAAILYSDALEQLSKKVGTDLYILPSSIHETIAISVDYENPSDLAEMVREVNATQVSIEEQLSDHVYKYDAKAKTLSIADDATMQKQEYVAANNEVVRPRHHR